MALGAGLAGSGSGASAARPERATGYLFLPRMAGSEGGMPLRLNLLTRSAPGGGKCRFKCNTISLICLDHWLEANATWHRHPADVLSPFIWQRWYKCRTEIARGPVCPNHRFTSRHFTGIPVFPLRIKAREKHGFEERGGPPPHGPARKLIRKFYGIKLRRSGIPRCLPARPEKSFTNDRNQMR